LGAVGLSEMNVLEVVRADITSLRVDAIVNAANSMLLGGGGVDGAIHQAAGPLLLAACRELNGCPTGEARITAGYRLPAKHVIHTVGPVWRGGRQGEDQLLADCYRSSVALAVESNCRSLVFPAISTGVYGFPRERAASIAVRTLRQELAQVSSLSKVLLVALGEDAYRILRRAMTNEKEASAQ